MNLQMEHTSFLESQPTPGIFSSVKHVSVIIYVIIFVCIVQLVFAISASFPQVPLTEVIATCSSSMDVPNESIVTGAGRTPNATIIKCYQRLEQMNGMTFWRSLEETLKTLFLLANPMFTA